MNTAITSLKVYDSSGVGCRSSSCITKRKHQLPKRMRQLRCGAPHLLLITKRAHSSPSAYVNSGVGHRSCSSSPRRVHSSAPSRVHSSSGVGCRSNSSITKRVHQLPERMRQLRCGVPQLLRHHRARTSTPVWGAAATPSSPSAHVATPPNVCRSERRR